MALVNNIGFCRLGGFAGSNPEILDSYPPFNKSYDDDEQQEILSKSMPHGIKPGDFTLAKFRENFILSYTFSLKNRQPTSTRDDLASITVVVPEKNVIMKDFKILFEVMIEHFNDHLEEIASSRLAIMLERIYNGFNDNKQIKINELTIDLPNIIMKKKLKIRKASLTEKKGMFL